MTARQRLERLSYTWYGFIVFAAACSVMKAALFPFGGGLFSSLLALLGLGFGVVLAIVLNAFCAAIGLLVTFLVHRALLGRSSFVRVVLLFLSPTLAILGTLSGLKLAWAGISHFSPSSLVDAMVAGVAVVLYIRSFKVLSNPQVGAYFQRD